MAGARERTAGVDIWGIAIVVTALLACADPPPRAASASASAVNRIKAIRAQYAQRRFYPSCAKPHPPFSPCGLLADEFWDIERLKAYVANSCPTGNLEGQCLVQLRGAWYTALFRRYDKGVLPKLPDVSCELSSCPNPWAEELEMLKSHDEGIDNEEALAVAPIQNAEADARVNAQLEAARQEQARRAALRNATQGITESAPALPAGCLNDYQCAYGQVCVKDSLAMRGVCAVPTDRAGLPRPQQPSPGSFLPGKGNCSFDTDCEIGYRCVKTSGGLYGNCLK